MDLERVQRKGGEAERRGGGSGVDGKLYDKCLKKKGEGER